MTFKEALKKLNIEDYEERIFNSNSRGELFHLVDYIMMAELAEDKDMSWFREWFVLMVSLAEKHCARPESIFQHIPRCLEETIRT